MHVFGMYARVLYTYFYITYIDYKYYIYFSVPYVCG